MALELATILNALATLSILIYLATRKAPTTVPGPPGPQGPMGMEGPAGVCKCNTATEGEDHENHS